MKFEEVNVKHQRVEIKTSEKGAAFTEVFIDGHKLEGVRSYKLEHKPNTIPRLTLDLNVLNIAVDQQILAFVEGYGDAEFEIKTAKRDTD